MAVLSCIKCKQDKDSSEFYTKPSSLRGFTADCKSCRSVRAKRHYEANKEAIKARTAANYRKKEEYYGEWHREYRRANKVEFRKRDRVKYLKNREEILKKCAIRYQNSKEEYLEARKRYKQSSRGKVVVALSGAKRRSRSAFAPPLDLDFVEKLRDLSLFCYFCGIKMNGVPKHPQQKTLDHLTPLYKGGTNASDNLAFVCFRCNCKKQTKTEAEFWVKLREEA